MANLSNINNHFIVDTSGKGVFGDVASFSSSGQHGPLNVFKSGAAAAICIDSSGGSGRMYQLRSETNGAFVIYDNPSCDHRMEISSGGEVTFSGNVKVTGAFKDSSGDAGTSGQILSSTATGSNWIDNDTGDVSGSGTTNAVAKFTGAKVIGDGPITFSSNDSTFAGKILVGVGTTAAASINAFSTTVSTGLHSALRIISQPSASNYWDIGATNGASTILNFYHNANTTPKITFTHLGGATFAGTISAVGASTFTLNDGIFIKAVNGTNNVAATNVWGYGLYEGASKLGEISLVRDGSNSQMYIGTTGANQVLRIGSANKVTALTIDASQNVGIGTDSPDGKLEVAGGTTLGLRITNAGDSSAYDQTRITYSGYNSGSPEMVFMPLTTPGSGVLNTFFRFRNTNGSSTTSNNVANVSIDGELGIGTDSPVQPLHVNGQVLFRTTTADGGKNRFQLIPGGSSDAANLYLYYGNSGDGTLSVRINAQGDSYFNGGNVGIGVTSPDAKLDVQSSGSWGQYGRGSSGDINVENTNTSVTEGGWISIAGYMGNTANSGFYHMAGITAKKSTTAGDGNYGGDLSFWTTSGGANGEANSGMYQRMTIDSSGDVGIGTTSPSEKLQIVGNTYISGVGNQLLFDTTGALGSNKIKTINDYETVIATDRGSAGFAVIGNSNIRLGFGTNYTNAETDLYINTSGNVGIGETSPNGKLHIKDGLTCSIDIENTSNTGLGEIAFNDPDADDRGALQYSHNLDAMIFKTDATEQVRILPTGSFCIGGTAIQAVNAVTFDAGSNGFTITNNTTSGAGNGHEFQAFRRNSTQIGSIVMNGTTGVTYATSSDYRLKEDLQDFNGLDKVSKIPVYDFKWKSDESRSYGVMAHELQEVLPQAVSGDKDAEEMQGVDYSKIVPLLVKSIQELKARVKELENK